MSTKGHHGTRIALLLAASPDRPVTKAEIGRAEGITPGYAHQLLATLAKAGLVQSHRGKAGGFTLSRPAERITVRQVLQATEGDLELAPCIDLPECCGRSAVCPAHVLWTQATTLVNDLFDRTSIADLLESARLLEARHASPRVDSVGFSNP
jgi:Rrf2 family protein